jgi:hypothetical protein
MNESAPCRNGYFSSSSSMSCDATQHSLPSRHSTTGLPASLWCWRATRTASIRAASIGVPSANARSRCTSVIRAQSSASETTLRNVWPAVHERSSSSSTFASMRARVSKPSGGSGGRADGCAARVAELRGGAQLRPAAGAETLERPGALLAKFRSPPVLVPAGRTDHVPSSCAGRAQLPRRLALIGFSDTPAVTPHRPASDVTRPVELRTRRRRARCSPAPGLHLAPGRSACGRMGLDVAPADSRL